VPATLPPLRLFRVEVGGGDLGFASRLRGSFRSCVGGLIFFSWFFCLEGCVCFSLLLCVTFKCCQTPAILGEKKHHLKVTRDISLTSVG
jgi:hypothetical protein